MSNWDHAIGLSYMSRTHDDLYEIIQEEHGEEGQPGEPLKFKIYRGVKQFPLSQSLPLLLGDARQSFVQQSDRDEHSSPLTYERLSTLLYYTFGFSRHDTGPGVHWPFHRLVPSARCFFPAELYLWLPQLKQLPAGLYHYDALHHRLALLREGEQRALLGSLLGTDIQGCEAVLFVSSYFWKMAFVYRNFAYRLCTQEAGIVIGNVLLVAGTLGLQAQVHYQFLDDVAHRLLGFEADEESLLAAIPLYADRSHLAPHPFSCESGKLLETVSTITPSFLKYSALDHQLCRLLVEIDRHSLLTTTDDFVRDLRPDSSPCRRDDMRIAPPAVIDRHIELSEALHRRSSGDIFFSPLRISLAQSAFWEIIRNAQAAYSADITSAQCGPCHPNVHLYLAVNNVQGLEQGVYRLCNRCGHLHVIELRDVTVDTMQVHTTRAVGCFNANMVCYLVADYPALQARLGNRAYRIMNMESGLIAQRICVMSAAYGLVSRCSDSYFVHRCKTLLKLDDRPETPIFHIAVGHEQPGAHAGERYKHAIRF